MRVQRKDWEGWLHRFAGLHIVHLEKKNGKLYNCHRNHYQFRFLHDWNWYKSRKLQITAWSADTNYEQRQDVIAWYMKGEVQYYEKLEKNHSNYGHGMSYDRTKWVCWNFWFNKKRGSHCEKSIKGKIQWRLWNHFTGRTWGNTDEWNVIRYLILTASLKLRYKKRGIFIRLLEEIQQLGMRVSII